MTANCTCPEGGRTSACPTHGECPLSNDEKRLLPSLEDWGECDLQNAGRFEVMRAFNGVVVRPASDYSRDHVTTNQMLVFQNPEHFWDWFQRWLDTTRTTR